MKVSNFYDLVAAFLLAIEQGKTGKATKYADKLRQELKRIEIRKKNGYKLPWFV